MKLELTDEQALVFFEWLARYDEAEAFPVEDRAEEYVFWQLHGQLEKALSEPFLPNYRDLLHAARERVRQQFGGEVPGQVPSHRETAGSDGA